MIGSDWSISKTVIFLDLFWNQKNNNLLVLNGWKEKTTDSYDEEVEYNDRNFEDLSIYY